MLLWRNKKKHDYFSVGKKSVSLRKHAYSNILKILPPKKEKFHIKKSDIFHIPAQNIDCGYSLEQIFTIYKWVTGF